MPVLFGIDASSYQGRVNWTLVDEVTAFGAEKVTEGVSYTNPYWLAAKAALTQRAKATGLVPLCYHFLDAGPGAAQADHFMAVAGNLTGFGIVLDFERAPNGPPSVASAKDCVARLRQHYPSHPIGLYAPRWFTGSADLSFGSWTWSSSYVGGKGTPASLYAHVSAGQWAPYGGKTPTLLQFSDSAIVPGVSGLVDISAFKGTPDQLRAIVLPPATPPLPNKGDVMHGLPGTVLSVQMLGTEGIAKDDVQVWSTDGHDLYVVRWSAATGKWGTPSKVG